MQCHSGQTQVVRFRDNSKRAQSIYFMYPCIHTTYIADNMSVKQRNT